MIDFLLGCLAVAGVLFGVMVFGLLLELVLGGHLTWRREMAAVQRRACEQQQERDMAKTAELKTPVH